MIHEIFGYNPYHERVARDLAKAGYSAAAVDLFRGVKAGSLEEGMKLRESVTNAELQKAISAGAEALKAKTGARAIGTMGF